MATGNIHVGEGWMNLQIEILMRKPDQDSAFFMRSVQINLILLIKPP